MCFIRVVGNPEFKDLIYTLKPSVKLPGHEGLIDILEEIKTGFAADITNILRDEYVSTMTDGWTSSANDSYLLLSRVHHCRVRAGHLPLNCTMS